MYGVTNVFDDFAETFAIYVHTRLLGKPYKVELFENDLSRFTYTSCVVANTCPQKVKLLESILGIK